jgi:hypothetical protein
MASSIGNGMANPAGGLAINQLVKMRCAGQIKMDQFLELTAGVDGFVKDNPVELCDADEVVTLTAAETVAEVEEIDKWSLEAVHEKGAVVCAASLSAREMCAPDSLSLSLYCLVKKIRQVQTRCRLTNYTVLPPPLKWCHNNP